MTADAMDCQRQVARQVMEQSGDYVLALKGSLNDDVRFLWMTRPRQWLRPLNSARGMVALRPAPGTLAMMWNGLRRLTGLAAVGKVVTRRDEQNGRTSVETRYYLMSQAFSPERFNDIVRSHWGIENRLHWSLDVVFNEDQARNRKGHCAENLALLRKLALNLARLEPSHGSMRGKLKRAGWDNRFLATLLTQFANLHMR